MLFSGRYVVLLLFTLWYICSFLFCKDVDLVWFRDPMQYFHDYRAAVHNRSVETGSFVDAFFSDDGQRSMRVRKAVLIYFFYMTFNALYHFNCLLQYTPFYANSGFYYLVANEKSTYFAWSIMAAMDAIQVRKKHQYLQKHLFFTLTLF